jgi:hypothetical protein
MKWRQISWKRTNRVLNSGKTVMKLFTPNKRNDMKKILFTLGLLLGLAGTSEAGQPVSVFQEAVSTHPVISGIAVTDAAAVQINTKNTFSGIVACNTSTTHILYIANRSDVSESGATIGIPIAPGTCGGSATPIANLTNDIRHWYAIFQAGGSATIAVVEYR